jgi:hypothetical protein
MLKLRLIGPTTCSSSRDKGSVRHSCSLRSKGKFKSEQYLAVKVNSSKWLLVNNKFKDLLGIKLHLVLNNHEAL